MTTGITSPASFFVTALNSLQNAMMLTPCWPSDGPTGGAGFAWPAAICSLMYPVIFFAIKNLSFLDLPVFQFNRRVASENVHGHFQLAAIGINLLDHAAEIQERPVVYLDRLADFKIDLRFFRFFRRGNLNLDRFDFFRRRRH